MEELERDKEKEVSRVEFEKLSSNVENMAEDLKDLKNDVTKVKEDVDRLETSQTRIETELVHIKSSGARTEAALDKLIDTNTISKIHVIWGSLIFVGGAAVPLLLSLII